MAGGPLWHVRGRRSLAYPNGADARPLFVWECQDDLAYQVVLVPDYQVVSGRWCSTTGLDGPSGGLPVVAMRPPRATVVPGE
jgi:hypothetical protein